MSDISKILDIVEDLPGDIQDVFNKVNDVFVMLNDAINNVINDIPDDLQTIIDNVRDLPDSLQAIKDVLQTVADLFSGAAIGFRNILEQFFEACGNILQHPIEVLLQQANFVKSVFSTLGRLFIECIEQVFEVVVTALEGIAVSLAQTLAAGARRIARLLETIFSKVMDFLSNAIAGLGDLPDSFKKGPLNSGSALRELYEWLRDPDLNLAADLRAHMDAVTNSLGQLFSIVNPSPGLAVVEDGIAKVDKLLQDLATGATGTRDIIKSYVLAIAFPVNALANVFGAMAQGKIWNWIALPAGFGAGELHEWLNSGYSDHADIRNCERVYRLRIVGAADSFLREQFDETRRSSGLTISDRATSVSLVSDVVSVFLEQTIQFALEPLSYPIDIDQVGDFEDVGESFARFIGRQARSAMRATVGTLLRGIWSFSLQNDALIELIASSLATVFSGVITGIARNLTWTLQVIQRYQGDDGDRTDPIIPVYTMDTVDQAESLDVNNNDRVKIQRLEYAALLRSDFRLEDPPSPGATLRQYLDDFAAYLDMCYAQYLRESRFGTQNEDSISLVPFSNSITDGRLFLAALCPHDPRRPRPVLRVYVLNQVFVMFSNNVGYELVVDLPYVPSRPVSIVILSSRGGRLDFDLTPRTT